jgi:predicted PurR-regulated permease PerM
VICRKLIWKRLRQQAHRGCHQAEGNDTKFLATALILLGVAVGLFLVWETGSSLVIICARRSKLPPAWTLIAIVLFGVLGIALSMPLLAIGRVAVLRFYVEDWLGDKPN